jgi:Ca2+-binding EF-hand superfamily protein
MTHLPLFSACLPVVIGLCLISPQAQSAEKDETKKWTATKMFEKKDTNKNGFLTLEEFKQGGSEKFFQNAEKRFSKLDTNHDDKVSLDELKSGWADMTRNKKKPSSLQK